MAEFDIPPEVSRVTETLESNGFEAYLVGGCTRDLLLRKNPRDWDIATNATPDEIQPLFDETYYNNEYGTVGVVTGSESPALKIVEVTPYRTESNYSNARHPDAVSFSQKIEDDLKRRDFTINAIAYSVSKGHIIDLYKGQEDIKDKIIRAVGNPSERFAEDALRMLRAVRLGAELGFSIEQATFEAINLNRVLLGNISKERIRDEFMKIIMSHRPMEGILYLRRLELLEFVLPQLLLSVDVDQNHSHKYPVFEHLLLSLQHAADKNWPLELRLAALFHDISKPATRRWSNESGDWTFYGHEVVGSRETKRILTDLKFPQKIVEKVVTLVRWHMFFSDPDKITLSAVRRMVANVGTENIEDLLNLRICDRVGSGRAKEQPFRFRKYKSMVDEALRSPVSVGMLKIDGRRVMEVSHETPGPRIGLVLHALLEEVFDDPSRNSSEYLENRAVEYLAMPENELLEAGKRGQERKDEEEERELAEIRKRHGV